MDRQTYELMSLLSIHMNRINMDRRKDDRIHMDRRKAHKEQTEAIRTCLSPSLQRAMDLKSETGSSSWLTVLPLQDQRFHLHKQEFWDALHLRYGWKLANTSSHCVCGSPFTPDHAMICQHGGLTFVHHNEIHDITAEWLNKVCYDVAIEPTLQQLNGETIVPATANRQDEACAISMLGDFGGDVRVPFLMSGFFTQMHLVIATQISHPSIGVMSRRRSGSMAIVLGKLRRPLLLP